MKRKLIKQLDTIIDKLINVSSHLQGNQLQDAIREVYRIRDRIEVGNIALKK